MKPHLLRSILVTSLVNVGGRVWSGPH